MTSFNFSDYAQPLLDQLTDDPDRPPQNLIAHSTTFPGIIADLGGDLQLLEFPEYDSLANIDHNSTVLDLDCSAARDAYSMAGIDVLAFYKSFRYKAGAPFPGKWGIFLLDAGVSGIAAELKDCSQGLAYREYHQLAIDLLLAHERYHFWIDVWTLAQECIPKNRTRYKQYEPYLLRKKEVELTPFDFEESLANHYAFNKLKRRVMSNGKTAGIILKQVLRMAPIPYSDFSFDKYKRTERESFLAVAASNGLNPLCAIAAKRLLNDDLSILSALIKPVDRQHPIVGDSRCPVYYVSNFNYAKLVQPFQGPDLAEFRNYITKYLSGKFLEHTDHDYYRIDNLEKIKIPNPHDKTVRGYELKGTILKAGMTHKEYLDERQRTKRWTKLCPRTSPKPPRDEYN